MPTWMWIVWVCTVGVILPSFLRTSSAAAGESPLTSNCAGVSVQYSTKWTQNGNVSVRRAGSSSTGALGSNHMGAGVQMSMAVVSIAHKEQITLQLFMCISIQLGSSKAICTLRSLGRAQVSIILVLLSFLEFQTFVLTL
jgi:hypothetical protein